MSRMTPTSLVGLMLRTKTPLGKMEMELAFSNGEYSTWFEERSLTLVATELVTTAVATGSILLLAKSRALQLEPKRLTLQLTIWRSALFGILHTEYT